MAPAYDRWELKLRFKYFIFNMQVRRLASHTTKRKTLRRALQPILNATNYRQQGISLDYLVGKTDLLLDQSIIDKIQTIQKLPEEDRHCIMYALDGLVKNAQTKLAYTK